MERINRLYLIRHGQIVGHENRPVYGQTDVDITDVGRLQMERIAEKVRYANIKAIYSSDLMRSIRGAEIIGQYHDVSIHSLKELREVFFGDWEGLTLDDLINRYSGLLNERMKDPERFRYPGGESMGELSHRVIPCLDRIRENHNGGDFLIVGHGAVNRIILCKILGIDLKNMFRMDQDYGCLNIIDFYDDNTNVKMING